MNTDRELTELAAKAAGIAGEWDEGVPGFVTGETDGGHRVVLFDPLTDDGDALRLAVTTGFGVYFYQKTGEVEVESYDLKVSITEWWGDDKQAATRRAIVRAAAEIGKAMP